MTGLNNLGIMHCCGRRAAAYWNIWLPKPPDSLVTINFSFFLKASTYPRAWLFLESTHRNVLDHLIRIGYSAHLFFSSNQGRICYGYWFRSRLYAAIEICLLWSSPAARIYRSRLFWQLFFGSFMAFGWAIDIDWVAISPKGLCVLSRADKTKDSANLFDMVALRKLNLSFLQRVGKVAQLVVYPTNSVHGRQKKIPYR